MTHHLSLWRAAQLVGVARNVLRQQVRQGLLTARNGLVCTDDLLRLYPGAALAGAALLGRVAPARNAVSGAQVPSRRLPSQAVLAQRVFGQSQELADVSRHLQRYHALVLALQQRVRQRLAEHPGEPGWPELERAVTEGLAQALATEPVDALTVLDGMLQVVSAQVTVRPSGHQFPVHGRASLLQAGLQAGLQLNYGCSNGSCGLCKARVIAGSVVPTRRFDYPLSDTEKEQGYTLMCCHSAASSQLTLETLEASGAQDIAAQQIATPVRAVTELAPNTRLLRLQTPRHRRLRYLAGQSVQLGWALPGQASGHASYPLASCPCDDGSLLFLIERNEADALARHLFAGDIVPGASVMVQGPSGGFVLAAGNRALVFAACDTGFAPIRGLIEQALARGTAPNVSLFWLATRSDGHVMANQCRAWSQALDHFEYELVTHSDSQAGAREIARAMRADLFDIDCDFYLAGPADFVQTLHQQLRQVGVPAAQIARQTL